ncbi:hypothetical protein DFP72DRAFT_1123176 [Ephemerocybe angulata]|uniref:Deacetylase sirtuin-type domain-containing protein n=1 Tax=Ephemerocybe angulata TaxID=980116 RepID=A0A8H6H5Q6_9AGAR|nr:hypothetical protein DFP72DRAFT_1123176 [Tulosesus angulatus]
MTVFLPLVEETPIPKTPPFLVEPADRSAGLAKVVQAVLKAKRIVVICDCCSPRCWHIRAGGDSRLPLNRRPFQNPEANNPREGLGSGKDLFDASVFNSEHTTSLFCQMMAQLSDMSQNAEPTAFHQLLRALDDRGRLLRVYTQNIDAIEQKCGLSFGVPDIGSKKVSGEEKQGD